MADTTHSFRGKSITVRFDATRCLHAGECVRGLPQVFDPRRRPWVDADAAEAERIAEVVRRCPTGALTYERTDGGEPEAAPRHNRARLVPNGPLEVRGRIELRAPDGRVIATETRASLCRCGASRRKPYCDNSHATAEFVDGGRLPDLPEDAQRGGGEALVVELRADGPLHLSGAMWICGADGHEAQANELWLCRCGASGTRPFCDGTHKKLGFRSG